MTRTLRRAELTPAFVLHHRPYRDTSRIVEAFSREQGRITLFARGARGPKSRTASLLRPFVPLLVSWRGHGEAAQLTAAELAAGALRGTPGLPADFTPRGRHVAAHSSSFFTRSMAPRPRSRRTIRLRSRVSRWFRLQCGARAPSKCTGALCGSSMWRPSGSVSTTPAPSTTANQRSTPS